MTQYLLDTTPLAAYLLNRHKAVALITPWIARHEVATSVIVYAEVVEYTRSKPNYLYYYATLHQFLADVQAIGLDYPILDRYSVLRRSLRPPYGPGLIGDLDTLIAATALEHNLTVVTA